MNKDDNKTKEMRLHELSTAHQAKRNRRKKLYKKETSENKMSFACFRFQSLTIEVENNEIRYIAQQQNKTGETKQIYSIIFFI